VPDEYLTVAEIADRLKINPQTVRNWIDRGELTSVRLGSRRVRVLDSELQRFIAESAAAKGPSKKSARQALSEALAAVKSATTGAEEATALRGLARASTALPRVLSR
jgi:excisionase family DNA binding protein